MQANPSLLGGCLDLPHVVEGARAEADRRGLSDRSPPCRVIFVAVPPPTSTWLKMILHDWDDERALTILRNCRSSVNESGRAWSSKWSWRDRHT